MRQDYDIHTYGEIFINECYKPVIEDLNSESIVIDIGAHIGLFSLYIHTNCKKIYAYEANKEHYDLGLRNAMGKNIEFFNRAAWSNSNDELYFSWRQVELDENKAVSKVKTINLNDIFKEQHIEKCDLIKIDIEGSEYEVLLAVSDDVFNRTQAIIFEYHPDINRKHNKDELLDLLKTKGFELRVLKEGDNTGLIYARKA